MVLLARAAAIPPRAGAKTLTGWRSEVGCAIPLYRSPEGGRWRRLAMRVAVLMRRRASDVFAPPGMLLPEARRRSRRLRRRDVSAPVLARADRVGCRFHAPTFAFLCLLRCVLRARWVRQAAASCRLLLQCRGRSSGPTRSLP